MKLGDIVYRYYTGLDGAFYLTEYKVIKETPKGVWIADLFYDGVYFTWKKFMLLSARKQFAHDNKRSAMHSYIMRKYKQLSILDEQLKTTRIAIAKATDEYQNMIIGDNL